ncbi:MAG: OpgC domain-containing protein [Rhodocyclaceae bacterium]
MTRRPELDALRGLMLVLMTLTHLPTRLAEPFGQPFGFVSAAEGFVFLSAFMAGMIYSRRALKAGLPAMQQAFLRRAVKIYLCQAALLVFLFTAIAAIGIAVEQPAITNLISFFLKEPHTALWSGLALLYNPPLLDILPLYVLFMLVSPLILTRALTHGWHGILLVSLGLWCAAQFDLGHLVYRATVATTGLPVPFQEMGSFETLGWQFLWIMGLWMGATSVTAPATLGRLPAWMLWAAGLIVLAGFIGRHAIGQVIPDDFINPLFDKWHLGPMRMLNFCAMLILITHFGPTLRRVPQGSFLRTLGAASLPVYCAHLVIVLFALALVGAKNEHSPAVDTVLVLGSMAVLYAVACLSAWADGEPAQQSATRRAPAMLKPEGS